MDDFESLKRQAESLLGKDAVEKIERELRRTHEKEKMPEFVDVKNAELQTSEVPKKQAKIKASGRESPTERLIAAAVHREYLYAMLGLILGLATIIGGVVLGLNGVAGSTSWTANFLGLESQINDAVPGVVLFIVGVFMILITKPRCECRIFETNRMCTTLMLASG